MTRTGGDRGWATTALVAACLAALAVQGGCRRAAVERPMEAGRQEPQQQPTHPLSVPAKLPRGAQEMLLRNGFVVLGNVEAWELTQAYSATHPDIITSDAVLYVFHALFRGGLTEYERARLVPLAREVIARGLEAAQGDRAARGADRLLAEPARRNLVFFSVADALMRGGAAPTEAADAAPIVAKVLAAQEWSFYPGEDYRTYLPRGVYADDGGMARYFRATKWLGRRILPILPGAADKPAEAAIRLRQAWLLGRLLQRQEPFRRAWRRLYDDVGFFLGRPDSFTPLELVDATRDLGDRLDDAWIAKVRARFASPRYAESKIVPVPQANPDDAPRRYVQFLGERYNPDGQIMQETCFPYTSRKLPRALDVGFALFGSDRALAHLAAQDPDWRELEPQLQRLAGIFGAYGAAGEPGDVYAGWVAAIREVVHPPMTPYTPGFMHTEAWADKSLATCLAAWTELRHDFILYAKVPVIAAGVMMTPTLVEPLPVLYARLEGLSGKLAAKGFAGFPQFEKLCRNLRKAAEAELAGRDWRTAIEPDAAFSVQDFGEWLKGEFAAQVAVEKPCIIADVAASFFDPQPVLHEATGPLDLLVVEHKGVEYRGWVLSHFELTEDNLRRLTDADWVGIVEAGRHNQYRPWWVASYLYGVELPRPPQIGAVAPGGRG